MPPSLERDDLEVSTIDAKERRRRIKRSFLKCLFFSGQRGKTRKERVDKSFGRKFVLVCLHCYKIERYMYI